MKTTEQPAREANIDAIVAYFESGAKPQARKLGIELEHTLVHGENEPVSYSGTRGVEWLLEQLAQVGYAEKTVDAEGDLMGVSRPGEAVTIEPAAQVELSAGPFATLADAQRCYEAFEETLARILETTGDQAMAIGYNPVARAVDLELIPKKRYRIMNQYLGEISMYGICMMRGSASTQISIDYRDEADALRKMRLAFACTPLFALMCDNSPIFENALRPHPLMRTEIWKHCDPDRCNTVPGIMDPAFTLRDYAAYILDTPAIMIPCAEGRCPTSETFGEIYANEPMTVEEVEHALSMFFTDVRLKTYVEIRPADAMPIPYVLAYAALIKGLFYNDDSLTALEGLFKGVGEQDIAQAKESLMAAGYDGEAYGHPVSELCDELISIAGTALDENDRRYLQPLAELVASRTTLANLAEQRLLAGEGLDGATA